MSPQAKQSIPLISSLLTFVMMLLFFFLNTNNAKSDGKVDKEVFNRVTEDQRRDIDKNEKTIQEVQNANGEYFRKIWQKLGELEGNH